MQLKRSFFDDLRRAIIKVRIPDSINEYVNLIIVYDNDLRYLFKKQY
jgi:hypothetical protein